MLKLKFETVKDPSPFTESDVPKANWVVLLLPINVAFHVPLMLAGFLFEPHPTRAKPTTSKMKTANCFISESLRVKESEGAHTNLDAERWRAGGFGRKWCVTAVNPNEGGLLRCAPFQPANRMDYILVDTM